MAVSAHLVGSLAFESAEDAMRTVAQFAGEAVDWIPDGETGNRRKWLAQHRERLLATPGLVPKGEGVDAKIVSGRLCFGLPQGGRREAVRLDSFGYATVARESYDTFARLKADGSIPADSRFLVAIPTPLAVVNSYIAPDECALLEPVVERAFMDDVRAIAAAVPSDELAFQWDVAIEFMILAGAAPTWLGRPYEDIVERLIRFGDAVPVEVPLAYHLCYGSPYDTHFHEPEDTGLMVRVSNDVLGGMRRPVQRLHMPVPIERDDAAFYAPLADLRLGDTGLYLGLLHHEDGLGGARRRIAAAKGVVTDFGVGCECGTGRTAANRVDLLRLHVNAAHVAARSRDASIEVPARLRTPVRQDPEEINAQIRSFAQRIACPTCEVAVGAPCVDEQGAPQGRPHLDRHGDVVLLVASGQAPA